MALDAEWADLRSRCTAWVSPEDDIELRRVELWNHTSERIAVELMSMFEVALSEARADEAHPAFANLFVSADRDTIGHALYVARKPGRPVEDTLHAVHFITDTGDHVSDVHAQTDPARWLGRDRTAALPLVAYDVPVAAGGKLEDHGLGLNAAPSYTTARHAPMPTENARS